MKNKQLYSYFLLALLVVMQIVLSLFPVAEVFSSGIFLSVLHIMLITGLWAAVFPVIFSLCRGRLSKKNREYDLALEQSIDAFLNSLIKISSGNLTSEIKEESYFRNKYIGKAATGSRAGILIDQSMEELNAVTATPLKRISFTGGNNFHEGILMGEQIIRNLPEGGTLLIIIPFFSQVLHTLRAKGCISYIQQHSSKVKILPIATNRGNEEYTPEVLEKQFAEYGTISAVYITEGVSSLTVEQWLKKTGRIDSVSIFTHDITEQNIGLLERDTVKCLLAENFFAQSYNSIMNLYNALEAAWRPVSYKTYMDPLILTRENYHQYWDKTKNESILTDQELSALVIPEPNKSGRKWKIAVIMPTLGTFFTMAAKGAAEAKKALEKPGAEVEIIEAFKDWNIFASREAMEPFIRKSASENTDGICTTVFDRNLVPVINEVVDAGVAVTIFNSEPLSLREIILNVSNNISILQKNSTSLAASAEESARADEQIVRSMNHIEEGTTEQNRKLNDADSSVRSLDDVITNISGIITSYTNAVENMNTEAGKGLQQVSDSLKSFHELGSSFRKTDEQLNELQKDMDRIKNIISTIDSFSTDTNVLAINASIQAARAGERGKAFAVVAKEIRSLAEKSSTATEEIRMIIEGTLSGVSGVVEHSSQNMKLIEVNNSRFSNVNEAFSVISNHLKQSMNSIREIQLGIAKAAESSTAIRETMNNVSSGNNITLENIQEISVSLRELSIQSTELSEMAARYLELANTQEKVISQLSF